MLGHRDLTVDEYLSILRRRKWLIIIPALLGPIIAYGVSLNLASRYTSQTLVLVEQQKVPGSYVEPVVTEDLNARLATMQEQILSRTRLQPTIERFGLYRQDWGNTTMEELLERMRGAIAVTPVRSVVSGRQSGIPGFFISFEAADPRVAQQICAEITSMFIEENLRQREQSAQGTTDFLQTQLEDARRRLDEQDSILAQFKRRYIGALPDEAQTNMNLLSSLNTQLNSVTQSLNRAQQDKTYTESLLAQQLAARDSLATPYGPQPENVQQEIALMETQLLALESRYTNDHPDVIKLRGEIEQLRRNASQVGAAGGVDAGDNRPAAQLPEPPQILQLRSQVHGYEQAVRSLTAEQDRLQQQIRIYQSRIRLSPIVEQEYKEITRDHQTALDFYNDLLRKRNQSEMATDLERRQQGEQFRVMDPANLPEKPSYPDRPMFALAGFGGGIALGLFLIVGTEMRDKSLRTEVDVEFFLETPTLAVVPSIGDAENGRHLWGFLKTSGFWKKTGFWKKSEFWRNRRKKREKPAEQQVEV
jgi:polysaccharide chain length determinant protein (PEP-CTERM system associated)